MCLINLSTPFDIKIQNSFNDLYIVWGVIIWYNNNVITQDGKTDEKQFCIPDKTGNS